MCRKDAKTYQHNLFHILNWNIFFFFKFGSAHSFGILANLCRNGWRNAKVKIKHPFHFSGDLVYFLFRLLVHKNVYSIASWTGFRAGLPALCYKPFLHSYTTTRQGWVRANYWRGPPTTADLWVTTTPLGMNAREDKINAEKHLGHEAGSGLGSSPGRCQGHRKAPRLGTAPQLPRNGGAGVSSLPGRLPAFSNGSAGTEGARRRRAPRLQRPLPCALPRRTYF